MTLIPIVPPRSRNGEVIETGWFLCGCLAPGESLVRVPICSESFILGRRPGLDLTLGSSRVSGKHAEILVIGGNLFIRDLSSKNGTFVNRRRVSHLTPISPGDHIELADLEFRVEYQPSQTAACSSAGSYSETNPELEAMESAWMFTQLDELILNRAVTPYYQVIVREEDRSAMGYEALARSNVAGMENPASMFQAAEFVNREVELSLVCRVQAVGIGRLLAKGSQIFLNTHPSESLQIDVLPSVRKLRDMAPEHKLVVEVHERAIDDLKTVRRFIAELKEIGVGIAYDDFGAGRSRLLELIQAPPDYLKFDVSLIRNIHHAPDQQAPCSRRSSTWCTTWAPRPSQKGSKLPTRRAAAVRSASTTSRVTCSDVPSRSMPMPTHPPVRHRSRRP